MDNKLSRGAEATIEITSNDTLTKKRDIKDYRNPLLDSKLRNFRSKREYRVLEKLSEARLNVPKPKSFDKKNASFEFEYLKGDVLKSVLNEDLIFKAFNQIILMHKNGVIHGDLTTLNMIYFNNDIYIIDFGLAKFSNNKEERAVDLNLFFSCINNQHIEFEYLKEELIKKYYESVGEDVVNQLRVVESRGRNKNK